MFTRAFWKDAVERAIKTAAQMVIGGGILGPTTDAFNVDWRLALGFAATGFVMSLLTSIASSAIGEKGTASLVV